MENGQLDRTSQVLTKNLRETVRLIAPACGIDADQLIAKLPSLPANSEDPTGLEVYFQELNARAEDMTIEELQTMKLAHDIVVDIMHAALKIRFAHLPEFSEYEND